MLDSKYNIAVQNLSLDAVTTLQVFERHQPVKALEGLVRSDEAALNIILKESVRGKWLAAPEAGGGRGSDKSFPVLADVFLSRLSRTDQTMGTFKYDASGRNILRNVESSNPDEVVVNLNDVDFLQRYRPVNYIFFSPAGSTLDRSRSSFNRTLSLSGYNKAVSRSGRSLTVSADYEQESLQHDDRVSQHYHDESGKNILSLEEYSSGKQFARIPALELKYSRNDAKRYIVDHLRIRKRHSSYQARRSEDAAGTSQEAGNEEFEVLNSCSLLWRRNQHAAHGFSWLSQYIDKDESLSVDDHFTREHYEQTVRMRMLLNQVDFSASRQLARRWSASFLTSIPILFRQLNSGLQDPDKRLPAGQNENDFHLLAFRPSEDVKLKYEYGSFQIEIDEKLTSALIFSTLDERNFSHVASDASASASWRLAPEWKARVSGVHRLRAIDEQKLYPCPIMQGYHRLSSEDVLKREPASWGVSSGLDYSSPQQGLYFKAAVSRQAGKEWGVERLLLEDSRFVWTKKSDEKVPFRQTAAMLRIEKAFHDFMHTVSLTVDNSRYVSSITQDGARSHYVSGRYAATFKWDGNFSDRLLAAWESRLSFDRTRIREQKSDEGIWNAFQRASVTLVPKSWCRIESIFEAHLNASGQGRNSICFWDLHLDFPIKQVQLGLHLDNILNRTQYATTISSPLSRIDHIQPLRPFSATILFSVSF